MLTGDTLGPYRVLTKLGEGGMGEVYRAHDTRLSRDVAVKVLPARVANDPDRLARFAREAQVVASLNHPHIAQIYGLEDAGGVRAIVMELVEGPTLAERIAQGAIPLDDALPIAKQIAEALEAAHEKGIIHRDLKPANIKVRPDGAVKVLDFGLAKGLEDPAVASSPSAAMSPTLSIHATEAGLILGTAAYMSPEQAAGKGADRRSDLWAFGVVLLEMLTGRSAFTGETVSHVLAAVLKSDPEWAALPAETPEPIRRLLRRCLEKDRGRRLHSAADARLEIEDALMTGRDDTSTRPAVHPRSAATSIVLALCGGILLGALGVWGVMRRAPAAPSVPSRFAVAPPAAQPLRITPFESTLALSPDGRHLIYSSWQLDTTARLSGTSGMLMVRPLNQLLARPVASFGRSPFFSPDGAWVGFFDDNDFFLKKVSVAGGSSVSISTFRGGPRGASWSEDNSIVFATADPTTGLWRVQAAGGDPTLLTTPDASQGEGDHIFPSVLPGGRGILFTIAEPGQTEKAQVAVLDSKTTQRRTLIRGGSHAQYVSTGHLVYAVAGTLHAVRFDLGALQVLSEPVPVLDDLVVAPTGAAYYAVSETGTLVYVPGDAPSQPPRSLVWVDRQGREQAIPAPSRAYARARLSPDGTRVALDIREQENDIWIWDLPRETLRRLTYGPALDQHPIWTPDGRALIFSSDRAGPFNLYMQAADGTGTVQRLTASETAQWATSVTPDAARIVGHAFGPATSFDLFSRSFANGAIRRAPHAGDGARVEPLIQDPLAQSTGEVSPDGRYLAYQSNESGRFEIYVRPFPDVHRGKWQVSTDGGTRAAWARNGRELFYVDGSRRLMAAPVDTSGALVYRTPVKVLEDLPDDFAVLFRGYDVAPDGRFLMLKDHVPSSSQTTPAHIVVVLNWVEELKAKLPLK